MPICYLPHKEIDKVKWDACIAAASNGLIYAYSFYLDKMSKNWDALVWEEYKIVMPLTYNKKYGIYYLYQPNFTASLGVFGDNITASVVNDFLQAIPTKFKYWDIYLNYANYFALKDFNLYERINYVLPLLDSYENIYNNFKDNIKRNIKKASKLNCVVKKNISVKEVIVLAKDQSKNFSTVDDGSYERFSILYQSFYSEKKAVTYGVFSNTNQLLASAVFFFSNKRAYYILVGNHPNGKTIGASHTLINAFINEYAGQNLLLDFEGSDFQNVAFFYSSFGAVQEKYPGLKMNKLPKLLQFFKS